MPVARNLPEHPGGIDADLAHGLEAPGLSKDRAALALRGEQQITPKRHLEETGSR
jgi:hypothetical protein